MQHGSRSAGDITILLDRWTRGDPAAVEALTPLVYSHLRRLAAGYLRRERTDHTLQATGLVNELFLVLLEARKARFEDRLQFFGFSAQVMRRILVDHARHRGAAKRGAGGPRVELSPDLAWIDPEGPEIVDLDRLLTEMEAIEPRKAKAIELRIFLGCTSEEAAALLGVSKPTIDRDLRFAIAWLYDRMNGPAR